MTMLAKIPGFLKKYYPNRVWDLPNNEKKIYLTFDDGPIPEVTSWVLEQLNNYHAKATFFCIGNNVQKHQDLYKKIISEGHCIGNHTYNHLNGWKTSSGKYLDNVLLAEEVINRIENREEKGEKREIPNPTPSLRGQIPNPKLTNPQLTNPKQQTTNLKPQTTNFQLKTLNSKLFRPPYGRITGKQAGLLQKENYKIIMWDVLSLDYNSKISVEKCYQNVVNNTSSGSIIVFHDSLKAEKNLKAVLPRILEYYTKKGFMFEKLP